MQRALRALSLSVSMCIFAAAWASASTFIMPTDEEMVARSHAIIVGRVEGHYAQYGVKTPIETVYEIRLEQSIKGSAEGLVRVVSPGGQIGNLGVEVAGSAQFSDGDRVLLFLTRNDGRWETTDLMLGKFRFAITDRGTRILVRDVDDVEMIARNRGMHRELIRSESGFLQFVRDRAAGRPSPQNYFLQEEAGLPLATTTSDLNTESNGAPGYAPNTYTQMSGLYPGGVRWNPTTIAAGKSYVRRVSCLANGGARECDIGGTPDTVISNALAAWTNECGSAITLTHGGTTTAAGDDATQGSTLVIELNDPRNSIAGSFGGSGTVGVATIVFFTTTGGDAGADFREIVDAWIVFQDGYTAAQPSFQVAMTHEVGHTIGWRHSNAKADDPNGATTNPASNCNALNEDCDPAPGSAIMYWSTLSGLGSTLQQWDKNAARAVYPGGSCAKARGDSNADNKADIIWRSSAGANLLWRMDGTAVTLGQFIPTVDTGWSLIGKGDFNGDAKVDLVWKNNSTGVLNIWTLDGSTYTGGAVYGAFPPGWTLAATGDVDADGDDDILWRSSLGANLVWFMNGATVTQGAFMPSVATTWSLQQTGDFNNDNKMDLIWRENATGRIDIWIMNGTAFSSDTVYSAFPPGWFILATGDADADGDDDILWRNTSTGANLFWFMNGSSVVQGQYAPTVDTGWTLGAWGDFNADQQLDFVWRENSTGRINIWLMDGGVYLGGAVYSGYAPGTWSLVSPQ